MVLELERTLGWEGEKFHRWGPRRRRCVANLEVRGMGCLSVFGLGVVYRAAGAGLIKLQG
jgi:hypothetical protein